MHSPLTTLLVIGVILLGSGLPVLAAQASTPIPTLGIRPMVPFKLPADGGVYQAIFAQLIAPSGNIVAAPQDYQLFVTSSNQSAGFAQSPMVIQAGQTFGSVTFATTTKPGSTIITISGNGLTPVSTQLTTFAPTSAPTRVVVSVAPSTLVSDGTSSYFMFVQLQDINGTPSRTAQSLTVLTTSSDPAIVSVPSNLVVPAGGTYASSQLTAGTRAGNATITAQLNGFQSTQAQATGIYLPLQLSLTEGATGTVSTGSSVVFTVTATSSGVPVRGAAVSWSSSSKADTFASGTLTTDASGTASASLHLVEGGNVTVSAQVSANGYVTKTVSLVLGVKALALTVQLIPSTLAVNVSESSEVSAIVTSSGKPVAGAQVSWSSSLGTFNPGTSTTDASGIAKAAFVSPSGGNATITATAIATGYASGGGIVVITVGPPGGAGAAAGFLAFIPGPAMFGVPLLLVVVVLAVVLVLLVRLRRRRGAPVEQGEAAEGEPVQEESQGETEELGPAEAV